MVKQELLFFSLKYVSTNIAKMESRNIHSYN
jgi:hypothetical protein